MSSLGIPKFLIASIWSLLPTNVCSHYLNQPSNIHPSKRTVIKWLFYATTQPIENLSRPNTDRELRTECVMCVPLSHWELYVP